MRLSKELKKEIVNDTMKDIFGPRIVALQKRATKLADGVYAHKYGKDAAFINECKLDKKWFPSVHRGVTFGKLLGADSPVRRSSDQYEPLTHRAFCGYNSESQLSVLQVFPPHSNQGLKPVTAAHVRVFDKLRVDCYAIVAEEKALHVELSDFMLAVNTDTALIANWPEGKKYIPVTTKKHLPIPLLDNVRKAQK